jgi:hypothetical protein
MDEVNNIDGPTPYLGIYDHFEARTNAQTPFTLYVKALFSQTPRGKMDRATRIMKYAKSKQFPMVLSGKY